MLGVVVQNRSTATARPLNKVCVALTSAGRLHDWREAARMMYVFVRDACDALIATAPRRLRYQLIYNDMRLNFCSRDLDSVARAVMLA